MRLLVTRPEPDGQALRARLEAGGHVVALEPLTRIAPCPAPLDLDGVQALVATSRNALRALQSRPDLSRALAIPLFVVGPATASLAKTIGFSSVAAGPGDGRGLVEVIAAAVRPENGGLLHLAGDHVAFDIATALATRGYAMGQATLYRSVAVETLTAETRTAMARGDLDAVILMSPRASRIFLDLIDRANLQAQARGLLYFCLSQAVARPLEALPARRVEIAREANSEDMLRLVNQAAK